MTDFYRIVYVSQAKATLADTDIGSILDASASNNDERYLTGFLTLNHGRFMQVLEGPESEVREIYGRIQDDDRHSCVTQIVGEHTQDRLFPDWTMNYFRVDDENGHPSMQLRKDEIDQLMPASTPKPYLYLFSRFMTLR
ncbi:MAG: BLUF domain-containing protein [Pseudomonadota bacterium]